MTIQETITLEINLKIIQYTFVGGIGGHFCVRQENKKNDGKYVIIFWKDNQWCYINLFYDTVEDAYKDILITKNKIKDLLKINAELEGLYND